MTVITSDGLKERPEGPKGRRSRKKNKGKTEKVVPPIWESTKLVERLKYHEEEEQGEDREGGSSDMGEHKVSGTAEVPEGRGRRTRGRQRRWFLRYGRAQS